MSTAFSFYICSSWCPGMCFVMYLYLFFPQTPRSLVSIDIFKVPVLDLDLRSTDGCKSVVVVNNAKKFHCQYLEELK